MMKTAIDSLLYFFGLADNPLSVQLRDDAQSIKTDWENVGHDLMVAMSKYGEAR